MRSKFRQDCLQLDSNELDLVVLSCIQSHLSLPDQATQRSSHHDTSVDSQKRSKYFVHGVRVCRDTFLFVHALSHSRYERLVQHYKHVGLSSRMHGNKGRVPPNTLHFDEVTQLTTFIVNYARAHGMPLPGRVPGHRDKVMVLPSDITKAHVFTKYEMHARLMVGLRLGEQNSMTCGRTFYHIFQLVTHPLIYALLVSRIV